MPPDMAVSMRHTKLKAEEAALLAGEISKPSWESKNEGIHERVSFEDSIWGFDLAGGLFYKTPLRVTYVKPDSRAEKAGIRPGDRLLRINDVDTSTLTIQQAHDIIIESGIHLKISVTSPDDDEDAYYCYEDPIVDGYDSEEERRLEEEKARRRRVQARVSHYWSLQWPWVSKRRFIYRESNCFMVPSKYEDARRDKYPPLPTLRYTDDVSLYHKDGENKTRTLNTKRQEWTENEDATSELSEEENNNVSVGNDDEQPSNDESNSRSNVEENGQNTTSRRQEIPNIEEVQEENNGNNSEVDDDTKEVDENNNEISHDILSPLPEFVEESNQEIVDGANEENVIDSNNVNEINGDVNDDDVLNEVLGKTNDSASRNDDDNNILDSILSDDGQNLENSESSNER